MSSASIEDRVAALEAEVARLRAKIEEPEEPEKPWWKQIVGAFENDPDFEEAMRLGREWRESQRPKPRKSRKATGPRKKR